MWKEHFIMSILEGRMNKLLTNADVENKCALINLPRI